MKFWLVIKKPTKLVEFYKGSGMYSNRSILCEFCMCMP